MSDLSDQARRIRRAEVQKKAEQHADYLARRAQFYQDLGYVSPIIKRALKQIAAGWFAPVLWHLKYRVVTQWPTKFDPWVARWGLFDDRYYAWNKRFSYAKIEVTFHGDFLCIGSIHVNRPYTEEACRRAFQELLKSWPKF